MSMQVTTISPVKMGELIVAQGEALSEASEKAITVFKQNQEAQKQTIETLTKANSDLEAKLLKTQAEFAQYKAAQEALKKSEEAKKAEKVKKCTETMTRITAIANKATLLQDDLGPLLDILYGQELQLRREYEGDFTLGAHNGFPGGTVEAFIAHHAAKLKASHHMLNGSIVPNFINENKSQVKAIENEAKKILEELTKP